MEDNLDNLQEILQADDLLFDSATNITLLHMASTSGSIEMLGYLLDQGLEINGLDVQGNTPLHFAALVGYGEGISFLLENGADISVENEWGITPWQVARIGKVMHQLHPEDGIGLPLKSLREAVETEDVVAVKSLLQVGVNPNLLNHGDHQVEFRLPLHMSVDTKNLQIMQLLLEYGADSNAPHLPIHVPLEQAIKQNNQKMVQLLLSNGANPNHYLGSTPPYSLLHVATKNNQLEILELLLDYGGNPNLRIEEGNTNYHPMKEARSVEAIQLLVQYGANIDPDMIEDFLILSIERRLTDVIHEFIRLGAPVRSKALWNSVITSPNQNETTIPLCKLLLESGLDVNLPLHDYGSALIKAIHYQNIELVQLFLEYGVDLRTTDIKGYTPYEVAISILAVEISQLIATYLKEAGIPIPRIQRPPSLNQVRMAVKEENHTDLFQASYYSSDSTPKHHNQLNALMKLLQYAPHALPFRVYLEEEGDKESAVTEPTLSDYHIVFHPYDPRCFILIASWYDELTYRSIYHLHIRCEAKYEQEIKELFALWTQEMDENSLANDTHGHFFYHWNQDDKPADLVKIREEAERFYLHSVEHLQKLVGFIK
jgi:ankyrin repeat protein